MPLDERGAPIDEHGVLRDENGRFIKDNFYKCKYCDFSLPEKVWDKDAGEDQEGGTVDAFYTLQAHVEEEHLVGLCNYKDGTRGLCDDVFFEKIEVEGLDPLEPKDEEV